MKILMFADPGSAHTIKWVNYLSEKGVEIFLFGLSEFNKEDYSWNSNLKIESTKLKDRLFTRNDGAFLKLTYLKALPRIKKIIKKFNPDILHSHYASSYGLIGALSRFHPFIISVYGSDVFNFPTKNCITKELLKFNLSKADKILSTSKVMAKEIAKYSGKDVEITPFGIDISIFQPCNTKEKLFDKDDIVVGTVKSLEEKYGIEYLIRAFKLVSDRHPEIPLKLLLVGKGTKEEYYKKLVSDLGLSKVTRFMGYVNQKEISIYHNVIDISVFDSLEESFGVSVLEASACGKPVIVSDAGGLPEIVEDNITGIIVPRRNAGATADAIEKLLMDEGLRKQMGINGRKKVERHFNINDNVEQMVKIYNTVLKEFHKN